LFVCVLFCFVLFCFVLLSISCSKLGRQELEIVLGSDHISFVTHKILYLEGGES